MEINILHMIHVLGAFNLHQYNINLISTGSMGSTLLIRLM